MLIYCYELSVSQYIERVSFYSLAIDYFCLHVDPMAGLIIPFCEG